ncbi:MAG: complex I NDUFA9 subunit family protein [candidate division Zixibacteria bacterium]
MPNDDISHNSINKVAVLGGSGFIGSHLVLHLLQPGYSLNILFNKTRPDLISLRGRINIFEGNIDDVESLEKCFEGCDAVYHLVGIIAETRDKSFRKTVEMGTQNVVVAAKNSGISKIFYLSALGTSENSSSLYFQTKWAAEEAVRNSGLDYTIFRPSIVYGPEDDFINRIAKMVRYSPLIPVIGDGLYKFQPVYVEELCAVMALSSQRNFTSRQTYEIGGPERLTYLEILDIIKNIIGIKKYNIHLPMGLVKAAVRVLEKILKPVPITVDQLNMMTAGSTCDHAIVEKEFGAKFSSMEMQLPDYLRK